MSSDSGIGANVEEVSPAGLLGELDVLLTAEASLATFACTCDSTMPLDDLLKLLDKLWVLGAPAELICMLCNVVSKGLLELLNAGLGRIVHLHI